MSRPYLPSGPSTACACALVLSALWLGGYARRVAVHGDSMLPTLVAGDRLIVIRKRAYRPGAIVAAPDPRRPERMLVKRVSWHHPGGRAGLYLLGDNAALSTDSRQFGPVEPRLVLGQAVYRYAPRERAVFFHREPRTLRTSARR